MMMANAVFCKDYTETVLGLLVQCENAKRFWSELKTHIELVLGCELTIDPSTIILGNFSSAGSTPFNTIYLAA